MDASACFDLDRKLVALGLFGTKNDRVGGCLVGAGDALLEFNFLQEGLVVEVTRLRLVLSFRGGVERHVIPDAYLLPLLSANSFLM